MKVGIGVLGPIMRRQYFSIFTAAALFAGVSAPELSIAAATDDQAKVCVNASGDAAIGACTWVIQSGVWTGADLAWAYYNRGYEFHNQGQFARAIQDYDQAIALKPDYAEPRWNKGLILTRAGDYEHGWPLLEWRWRQPELRHAAAQARDRTRREIT